MNNRPPTELAESTNLRSSMTERLRHACNGITYAALARITGFHQETIRRYLRGQTPDVRFVAIIAEQFGWSAEWLLVGRGERRSVDARRAGLADATILELEAELALRSSGTPVGFLSADTIIAHASASASDAKRGDAPFSASAS